MRLNPSFSKASAGFTMTEIALCVAVIGIALVAIVGVLPSGLNVQRQNREDTLVAQDAQFLIEALRSGASAIPDLTNQVDFIRWRRTGAEVSEVFFRGPNYAEALPGTVINLTDSWQVTAILSQPRFEFLPNNRVIRNEITAQFRTFSGPFTEKPYRSGTGLPDPARIATALRYLVHVEAVPGPTRPPIALGAYAGQAISNNVARQQLELDQSLNDVRLTFQWPVFRVGNDVRVGNSEKTFRTQVVSTRQVLTTNLLGTGRTVSRFAGLGTNSFLSRP